MIEEQQINESDLIYIPAPEIRPEFLKGLLEIGGIAPNGLPRLQPVWGMDAVEYGCGNANSIKYPSYDKRHRGLDRFIIEQWLAPTMFNRSEWNASRYEGFIDVLGEYPEKGIYGLLHVVVSEDGGYAPLDGKVLAHLKMLKSDRDNDTGAQDAEKLRDFQLKKQALRNQRQNKYNEEADSDFDEYFRRADYHENSRAYSFSSKITASQKSRILGANGAPAVNPNPNAPRIIIPAGSDLRGF